MPLAIGIGIGPCYGGQGFDGGGGPPPWSPLDLSPALWLKADVGLFQERTGAAATTPAVADADPVGTWLDQSGNGNHVVATTDAKRPSLKLAIQNGMPVVRSDGTDDYLISISTTIATFPAKRGSVFAVYRRNAATGQGAILSNYPDTWQWYATTSGTLNKWYDGGAFSVAALYDSFVGFVAGAIIRDGDTTAKHYLDGALADSWTVTNNQPPVGVVAVGANTSGGELHAGDLAELFIFPTALDSTDRAALFAYLEARWGL